MSTQVFGVSGMTCGHCVNAVTEELAALPGVQGVRIELVAGGVSPVTIDVEAELPADLVRAAVHEAGYELAD